MDNLEKPISLWTAKSADSPSMRRKCPQTGSCKRPETFHNMTIQIIQSYRFEKLEEFEHVMLGWSCKLTRLKGSTLLQQCNKTDHGKKNKACTWKGRIDVGRIFIFSWFYHCWCSVLCLPSRQKARKTFNYDVFLLSHAWTPFNSDKHLSHWMTKSMCTPDHHTSIWSFPGLFSRNLEAPFTGTTVCKCTSALRYFFLCQLKIFLK